MQMLVPLPLALCCFQCACARDDAASALLNVLP